MSDTGSTDNTDTPPNMDDILRRELGEVVERRQAPVTQMVADDQATRQADQQAAEQWSDPDRAIRDLFDERRRR